MTLSQKALEPGFWLDSQLQPEFFPLPGGHCAPWGWGGDRFLGWAVWGAGHKRPSVCPCLLLLALPCSGSRVGVRHQTGQRGPPVTSVLT